MLCTNDYLPLVMIDSAFSFLGRSPPFFSRTENSIFSSFEKGTSTSMVPRKAKHMLIAAIEKYRGRMVSSV